MSQRYTREQLEGLRRADLQKIGKTLGLKANLKSDALIALILESSDQTEQPVAGPSKPTARPISRATSRPPPSRGVPRSRETSVNLTTSETLSEPMDQDTKTSVDPAPSTNVFTRAPSAKPTSAVARAPSIVPSRNFSFRMASVAPRSRDLSRSTVVIHEDDEDEVEPEAIEPPSNSESYLPPPLAEPVVPRRKAKDSQFRLGVGRPLMAGGSGARNITDMKKSIGQAPQGLQPTIHEEESDERVATPAPEDKHPVAQPEITVPITAGEAKLDAQPFKSQTPASSTMTAVGPSPPSVAMPMLDIFSFKGEIERQMTLLREQMLEMQADLAKKDSTIEVLRAEVSRLSTQVRLITNAPSNSNIPVETSNITPTVLAPSKKTYPSTLGKSSVVVTIPQSVLGKHSRESSTDTDGGPSNQGAPENKRKKLVEKSTLSRGDVDGSALAHQKQGRPSSNSAPGAPSAPSFKVFDGPEEIEPPARGTPSASDSRPTIPGPSQPRLENLNPFAPAPVFNFLDESMVIPVPNGGLPGPSTSFPFSQLQPEGSMTHDGPSPMTRPMPGFGLFGHTSAMPTSTRGAPTAAQMSSMFGLPLNSMPDAPSEDDMQHIHMMDENDKRFGDFGVQGLASIWSSSAPPPADMGLASNFS